MRFLFLNQFYPPDSAPTGRYLHEVATELVARKHHVRVVCSRNTYGTGEDLGPGEVLDGVDVRRARQARLCPASVGRADGRSPVTPLSRMPASPSPNSPTRTRGCPART